MKFILIFIDSNNCNCIIIVNNNNYCLPIDVSIRYFVAMPFIYSAFSMMEENAVPEHLERAWFEGKFWPSTPDSTVDSSGDNQKMIRDKSTAQVRPLENVGSENVDRSEDSSDEGGFLEENAAVSKEDHCSPEGGRCVLRENSSNTSQRKRVVLAVEEHGPPVEMDAIAPQQDKGSAHWLVELFSSGGESGTMLDMGVWVSR